MGTNMVDEHLIDIYDFNYDTLTIQYGCKEGQNGKCKIKILDNRTNFIIHQEVIDVSHGLACGQILITVKVLFTMW